MQFANPVLLTLISEKRMIEIDYGPGVLFGIILVAFLAPTLYSFFIDKIKK
jgi:hypothetical protein